MTSVSAIVNLFLDVNEKDLRDIAWIKAVIAAVIKTIMLDESERKRAVTRSGINWRDFPNFIVDKKFRLTRDKRKILFCINSKATSWSEVEVIVRLIKKNRFDFIDQFHFYIKSTPTCGWRFDEHSGVKPIPVDKMDSYITEFPITNWKSGTGIYGNMRTIELCKFLHGLFEECTDEQIMTFFERYESPDLKEFINKYFDEYAIVRCEERPELRMFLIRYVQNTNQTEFSL